MALALTLQISPGATSGILQRWHCVGRVESGNCNWKYSGAVPPAGCPVHCNLLRPNRSRDGILGSGFGHIAEKVLGVVLARSHMEFEARFPRELEGIDTKPCSGYIQLKLSNETRNNSIALLVRLMAKVQLLGILTALAMGLGVGQSAASSLQPPYTTGRNIRSSSAEKSTIESHQLTDCEEFDEDTPWTGIRKEEKQSSRIGAHTRGVAMAAEDEIGDDEVMREREEYRKKPYEITVPLKIVGLRGSVPPIWLKDFMGSQGKRVKLMAEFRGSLKSIFSELSSALEGKPLTSRSAMAADLVTVGDSWLSKAVSGGLIRPIENAEQYEWYQRMGSKWQTFVRRDEHGLINPHGKVWGVPYRWGSLLIAYNHAKLQKHGIPAIKDWTDLWNPELAGKISMVASPREVVGAVLKSLGASYNVNDFERDVPGGRQAMKEKFFALQNQVCLFDDVQYLKTLGAEDVWVAVGWSEDVISFAKRTSNITVIAPQSGTSLWADLWAIPATTTIRSTKVGGRIRGPSPLIVQWFDFCLQPARASSFQHDVLVGASPLRLSETQECHKTREVGSGNESVRDQEALSKGVSSNINQLEESSLHLGAAPVGGLLTPDLVAKSEFLEPLSKTALDDFKWLLSRKAVVPWFPRGILESLRDWCQQFIGRTG